MLERLNWFAMLAVGLIIGSTVLALAAGAQDNPMMLAYAGVLALNAIALAALSYRMDS